MAGGFLLNTRQKQIQLAPMTRLAGGGTTSIQLPKTGFLSKIWLAIRGAVSGTVTGPNALGLASIVSRVRLTANSGIDIFNVSGAGYHYMLRDFLESEYIDVSSQATARNAVTVVSYLLDMVIPVAINSRDPMGLLLLQNEQTILTLSIDWAAEATVATGVPGVTGTATPYLELFTVPPDPRDWPSLNIVHQILEDQQVVAGAGDFVYNWPRGNTYMQVLHGCGIAQSGTDAFSRYQLRLNQSDYLSNIDIAGIDNLYRYYHGRARIAGVIPQDFLASSGLGNFGLVRDLFNSAVVTDLASVITATGATTLYTIRRQLVNLGGA